MDFEQALQELGVDADPGCDTVRRVYLRRLKTCKPETDPEGFARLRQAYETVLAVREGREGPRTQAEPRQASTQAEEDPSTEAAGPGATPALPQDVLERFRAEFRALPPEGPLEAAVEVARRAVEAVQDSAEPRHWLVGALLAADRTQEALSAYRDAYRQGHFEFLAELAQRFPRALEDSEIALLGREAPHRFLWMLTNQLLQMDEVERAGRFAQVAFGQMGANPDEPPPPPGWFVQLVVLLHLHVQPALGRDVASRYVAWVKGEGLLTAFASEEIAELWPLVLELGALPDSFSTTLRSILAKALLDGRVVDARTALQLLTESRFEEVSEALPLLRQHAPGLYRLLGRPPQPTQKARRLPPQAPTASSPERAPTQAAPVAATAPELVPEPEPAAPEPVPKPAAPQTVPGVSKARGFRLDKRILALVGVTVLVVGALVVWSVLPSKKVRTRVEGPEVVELARQKERELCALLTGPDRQRSCVFLHTLVSLGADGKCEKLDAQRGAFEKQLRDPFVFLGEHDPQVQARKKKLMAARHEFARALWDMCEG
ncbi:hypothetical protein [Corallococcus terminator]|uniref:Molecular chaperone DnaJ n=1 Tax=Corallococcus terminator TaxID=2316733 RepID=A0A3A8JN39_9BACT|nr:hypothetical protein [Corallococcus terminator]RKG91941.1 hypothetical protein D7V88_08080 [Corallococcus terminator]